ncbi:hypothetical protein HMN09_00164600 [Mycena chlorophos]|uniref:Extracellular serine-rich protein n=1 Tax=Mycena chlorophos TaxID=658473 RepID=A0A8H6TN22_MYCCL|nr:hypothetical protein HMN09_00164600 [Mycena chlorophos]
MLVPTPSFLSRPSCERITCPMLLPLLLAAFVLPILAQVTHTVTVGVQGSFFDPPTVSANENDIILFVFGGDAHTVTQGSFEHPCVALPGGFDSGFQGRGSDFDDPTPVWSLTISNASEPIWFFCSATVPTSHCESGMVGVINPPSINMYAEFLSAAKAVTSTPQPSPSFMPSGQGAFATGSPMLSSAPLSSVLSAFSTPSVSPTSASPDQVATTTVAASASGAASISTRRANAGLIAGCVTAGALCVFVLLAVVFWYRKRSRGLRDPSEKPFTLGRDAALDPYMPSELPVGYAYRNASNKQSRTRQMATAGTTTYDGVASLSRAGGPGFVADERTRRHRDGTYPRPLPIPGVSSAAQLADHPQVPLDRDTTGTNSPDITALAMEVASVLLHTPPKPKPPPSPATVSGPRSRTRTWSRSGRRLSASLQNALGGTKSTPAISGTPTASDTGTSRWYEAEAERESASDDGLEPDLNGRASTSAAPPYSRYGE